MYCIRTGSRQHFGRGETRNDSRTKEDSPYLRAHLQDPFVGKYLAHAVETGRYFSRNPASAPGNNRVILSHILVRQEDTIPTSKESDSVQTATLLSDIFDKPLEGADSIKGLRTLCPAWPARQPSRARLVRGGRGTSRQSLIPLLFMTPTQTSGRRALRRSLAVRTCPGE